MQGAKKVVSDNPGLVEFAVGLVDSVLNLLNRQVMFYEGIQIAEDLLSILLIKILRGLFEMTFRLVHASYSLSEWQIVKLTFFAHCNLGFQTTTFLGISVDD